MSDIVYFPTEGKKYQVIEVDTLNSISLKAYGTQDYISNIVAVNPKLSTRRKNSNGLPELITGELLFIPVIPERRSINDIRNERPLTKKDKNDFTLIVDDREIPLFSAKLMLTMDTAADGFTGALAWNPGLDKELDKRLLPFRYPKAQIFLGNELQLTGYLYGINPVLDNSGRVKNLTGASFTAEMIDSNVRPPYELNNVNLKQIANNRLKQIGRKAIFETSPGGAFDRVTANPWDKIFDHLADLAVQRGILISSTKEGNALFLKAGTGENMGTLEEGQPSALSWQADYNGRRRFHTYKALGQSPGADAQTAIAIDENIPKSRLFTFNANDTTPGDIQKAADWKRSKMLADILTMAIPVSSWYAPNGQLWKPNNFITVISETLDLPASGVTLLIRSVEFIFEISGTQAVINVVPKEVYTGEKIIDPWRVK